MFIFASKLKKRILRYFVEISYLGSAYHGWQRQPNALSIQQVLEESFTTLLSSPIELVGAGRTDTGVHAHQMFAHFDVDLIEDEAHLIFRLNRLLPNDISILSLKQVKPDAHARFDALLRIYHYKIVERKDVFEFPLSHSVIQSLDQEAMQKACDLILGTKDFQCFSKSNTDVKTFICTITVARFISIDHGMIFEITADRFLRNMVRAIVGTLLEIGQNKYSYTHISDVLASKNRSDAGPSAPAKALSLVSIDYPEHLFL